MFKTFFLSEIKYVMRQPMIYIFTFIIALLVFGATVFDSVTIGGAVGNILRNSPYTITQFTTIMSLFGLLMATAFINNAALKDHQYNFNEILFSTPLSKAGYFFGRFFSSLLLSTIPMLGVFIGVIIGTYIGPPMGWVDADQFGPFFLETFVNNYFLFILPNMFYSGAIIFALANKWKSTVISFVGTMLIVIGYLASGTLLSDIDNETTGALLDTFGIRTYFLEAKYYTPIEKNTLSPGFSGVLLWNRLIWVGVGLVFLLLAYFNFSFKSKNTKAKKESKINDDIVSSFTNPVLTPVYNKSTSWQQFVSFYKMNLLSITRSTTFRILFLFSIILLMTSYIGGFESFGLKSYPVTYKMIGTIDGSTFTFLIIVLVFFSGELVWRDRTNKINEVIDATPHSSFTTLFAKALSLVSVMVILHVFFVIVSILYQLTQGYTDIEFGLYIKDYILGSLPLFFVWSGVMILVQVLVNNKYLGYFASILVVFVSSFIFSTMDIESNMVYIGSGPSLMYSDMNGFGPGLTGAIWFNIYWVLFAILALLLAGVLWNRGTNSSLIERFKMAKKQVPNSYKGVLAACFAAWLGVAGFVYYNTQILNPYHTSDYFEETSANYEKTYKKYEGIPIPKIKDVKYFIDIFPDERDAFVKAEMIIKNETNHFIDSLHFNLDSRWHPEIKISNASVVLNDTILDYRILKLGQSLMPGDSVIMEINTKYVSKGFENERGNTKIVKNGTFFNNFDIIPSIGYDPSVELSDRFTRKKYDLEPKERMPELESTCSDKCYANYLTDGTSDYINIETVISTSNDQMAIAPGSLIKEWEQDGRRYFNYKVDHISQHFCSFISADYEVRKRMWNGVSMEIYYDKKHDVNIDMMLDAVERSLDYYTKNFGPYEHKMARIIEFPRYQTFAQAFPGTMPYAESFGFIMNLEDKTENNVIDAVIAHEMAHQWWAHQVVGANMQGGTMMSESFAEYSSLMVMKSMTEDPMKMRKFLKYDHDRYLRGRGNELKNEQPLYKVENQQYIHYGKGSVLLYALQDYIGEETVNTAMKNFLEEYRYSTPYPTSLDFLKHLEPVVPDSMQYLIDDWFKSITLYDNRLKEATYKKLPSEKYEITLALECEKMRADSLGNETKVGINDWIDVGLYADKEEKKLMYQERIKINQPKMTYRIVVDSLPAKAAVDPRRILIDRIYKDNGKVLSEAEE